MDIYVCELVPGVGAEDTLTKIKHYNNKLIEWSFANKISIKTSMPFTLGTGEIDDMCFERDENMKGLFLNRYGIIRLLDTIIKQYPELNICEDLMKIKTGQYLNASSNRNFKVEQRYEQK